MPVGTMKTSNGHLRTRAEGQGRRKDNRDDNRGSRCINDASRAPRYVFFLLSFPTFAIMKKKRVSPVAQAAQEHPPPWAFFICIPVVQHRAPATYLASGNSQRLSRWWMAMEVTRSWTLECGIEMLFRKS